MFDIIKPNYWELESLGFSDIRTWVVTVEHEPRSEPEMYFDGPSGRSLLRMPGSIAIERTIAIDFINRMLNYDGSVNCKVAIVESIDTLPWFKVSIDVPYHLHKLEVDYIVSNWVASINKYSNDYFGIMEITAIN